MDSISCVMFDITRLYKRRTATHATGIDRVDINYALYLLLEKSLEVHFIYQAEQGPRIVPYFLCKPWIERLYKRWCGGHTDSSDVKSEHMLVAFVERAQLAQSDPLAGNVKAHISNRIYLNTSHYGAGNEHMTCEIYNRYARNFCYFVHDVIPITYPEYVRNGDNQVHIERIRNILRFQPTIIVNSDYTKHELQRVVATDNLSVPRIVKAYIGVEDGLVSRERNNNAPRRGHFLVIGTIEPRKNHITLLHVWRNLRNEMGQNCPKLIIVGARGWENDHVFSLLDRCPRLKDVVLERNDVTDSELLDLMDGASALLFPTFEEGWGMPLVEAMARGLPAIASDIPVLREAGQSLCDYVDPVDAPGWRRAVLDYCDSQGSRRSAQIERLRDFVPPTWQTHFETFRKVLTDHPRPTSHRPRRAKPFAGDIISISEKLELREFSSIAEEVSLALTESLDRKSVKAWFSRVPLAAKPSAVQVADYCRDQKRWADACAAYEVALSNDPDRADLFVQLGNCRKEAGDFSGAYEAYLAAERLDPDDADIRLQLGHLFNKRGHLPDAALYYELAAMLAPHDPDVRFHFEQAIARLGAIHEQ